MWSSSTHEASQKASWTNLYLCNFHPRRVTKETGQNDLFLACFRTNFLKTYVLKDDDRSFLLTAPEKKIYRFAWQNCQAVCRSWPRTFFKIFIFYKYWKEFPGSSYLLMRFCPPHTRPVTPSPPKKNKTISLCMQHRRFIELLDL